MIYFINFLQMKIVLLDLIKIHSISEYILRYLFVGIFWYCSCLMLVNWDQTWSMVRVKMLKMIIIMNFQHLFCLNNEKSWSGNVFKHHLMHAECNGPQRVRNLKFVQKVLCNRFFIQLLGLLDNYVDKNRGEGVSR